MKKYFMLLLLILAVSCNNNKISTNNIQIDTTSLCSEKEICILLNYANYSIQNEINNQLSIDNKDLKVKVFNIYDEMQKNGYEKITFVDYNGYKNLGYNKYDIYKYYLNNAKNFDIIQISDPSIIGSMLIQENIVKPLPTNITSIFPELLLEPFKYNNNIYSIPADNIYVSKNKIKPYKAFYFAIIKKNLIEKDNMDIYDFFNLLEQNKNDLVLKDYVWAITYPPNLTPIAAYDYYPFYINEETKTVELIYENEIYKKLLETLTNPNLKDRFYPVDIDGTIPDINMYSYNFDEENYVGIIEYPISTYNIYSNGLFIINHKNRNLGEELLNYILVNKDFANASIDTFGFSNLNLLSSENKDKLGKKDFSYENMTDFYSKNISCAFGLKFDLNKFDKQDLFLIQNEYRKYKLDVNALEAFNYDVLTEKMNFTKAKEISEELNNQLQEFLNGDKK